MAAAYAVMELIEPGETQVRFDTLSGRLTVDKTPDGLYAMDFPAYALSPVPVTDAMQQAIGARRSPIWRRSRASPSAKFSCLRTRSN